MNICKRTKTDVVFVGNAIIVNLNIDTPGLCCWDKIGLVKQGNNQAFKVVCTCGWVNSVIHSTEQLALASYYKQHHGMMLLHAHDKAKEELNNSF